MLQQLDQSRPIISVPKWMSSWTVQYWETPEMTFQLTPLLVIETARKNSQLGSSKYEWFLTFFLSSSSCLCWLYVVLSKSHFWGVCRGDQGQRDVGGHYPQIGLECAEPNFWEGRPGRGGAVQRELSLKRAHKTRDVDGVGHRELGGGMLLSPRREDHR